MAQLLHPPPPPSLPPTHIIRVKADPCSVGDYNVISVDWERLAEWTDYFGAAVRTKYVILASRYFYYSVTHIILRTHEGKLIFPDLINPTCYCSRSKPDTVKIKKMLLTCHPISELPSNINTMVVIISS